MNETKIALAPSSSFEKESNLLSAQLCRVGFGTYKLKKPYDATLQALKIGYRVIDTAVLYRNEGDVGRALVDSGLDRNCVFLCTKVADADQRRGPEAVRRAFHRSLELLRTSYVDLLLLHSPASTTLKSWQVLEELKDEGRVRHIGVSNFNEAQLIDLLRSCRHRPEVNQIELSPYLQRERLVAYCRKHSILVQAHSSLTKGQHFKDATLQRVAQQNGSSVPQVLLAWALQKGYGVLPRTDLVEHALENWAVVVGRHRLSVSDMESLSLLESGFATHPQHIIAEQKDSTQRKF